MMKRRPISLAVLISVSFVALLFCIAVAIGGSYLLTLRVISEQQAAGAALKVREMTAQIRAGIPTCHALQAMDFASKPPVTNASASPLSYGHKLAAAIHQVYKATRCQLLLDGVARHEPLTKILKQLTKNPSG